MLLSRNIKASGSRKESRQSRSNLDTSNSPQSQSQLLKPPTPAGKKDSNPLTPKAEVRQFPKGSSNPHSAGSNHNSNSNSSGSNSPGSSDSSVVTSCYCCGTLLSYPSRAKKFRCSVCNTTNVLESPAPDPDQVEIHSLSYRYVRKLVDSCLNTASQGDHELSAHQLFEPLSTYLYQAFRSYHCLNESFKLKKSSKKLHYSTSNIDFAQIKETFHLLVQLPTKRPLYNALLGASELARRIYVSKDDPKTFLWIIILLEIPFLSRALNFRPSEKSHTFMVDVPEIRELSYDILKRCLGILAHSNSVRSNSYFASWYSKFSTAEFTSKIELLNLYITFNLRKYLSVAKSPSLARSRTIGSALTLPTAAPAPSGEHPSESEYFENWSLKQELEQADEDSSLPMPLSQLTRSQSKSKSNKTDSKIKLQQYGNDWHIKAAAIVMSLLIKANTIRESPVPISTFYNSLIDYVNVKLDFDSWQTKKKTADKHSEDDQPGIQTILDYIHGSKMAEQRASYYLCQYPFLISLGGKISILEYEARRQMERKAEEAFINSLDKRIALDIYFRVRVRREYIVQDSLHCIKSNPNNLKKSLRVQFLNEPGVDAGGLRKEWFTLLTKEIFNPQTGMLYNIEDSNYLWFNIKPIENFEMYYLFGAILGLAIYNSTILDLKFPLAIYKVLLAQSVGVIDYKQLYPVSFKNLLALKGYDQDTLEALDLTFEVSYKDLFGNTHTTDLVPNGRNIPVDVNNRDQYIDKYCNFYLKDGIQTQLTAFTNGFSKVVGGNGLSLFSAEEIQLLICGSEDSAIDVEVLKSVTKYVGWDGGREEASNSQIVKWFWEYFQEVSLVQKKKFLVFVTGSDRVPATGIQNMSFKISLTGKDCGRLPVAHTCFNELALYNYSTKSKLVDKLSRAVNDSAGFGIK